MRECNSLTYVHTQANGNKIFIFVLLKTLYYSNMVKNTKRINIEMWVKHLEGHASLNTQEMLKIANEREKWP